MNRTSIRLGKIFGIEIRLDYSWFIIFTLVTISLFTYFKENPNFQWDITTSLVVGIVVSVIFFASVLAHEMGHSLVARATGVPVHSITLFIFGGVARITKESERPRDEFIMAIVGPAISIALGILFIAAGLVLSFVNGSVSKIALGLGAINVALALFNLIPGFPLDGGRVLRSIIWSVTQDFRKATRVASLIGRGVAYLFILWGVVQILYFRNWMQGLWIAFIGWFLENAAANSYRQVEMRDMMRGHTAREVMTTDCPYVPRNLTLEQLAHDHILNTSRRCFPVVDEGRMWGIVTLHDIKKIPQEQRNTTTVDEVMTPSQELKTVGPDDELFDVLTRMTAEDVNQLLVVDGGQLLGMVARDNILSFIHTRAELGI